MKLLDELRRFRREGIADGAFTTPAGYAQIMAEVKEEAKEARDKRIREDINNNPSLYNRATRRLHGLFTRAVPKDWVQPESSFFVPRYIRRHISQAEGPGAGQRPTRRNRRVRARMLRLTQHYQMGVPR